MKTMEELSSGVLVKFLEDLNSAGDGAGATFPEGKPALLQIRSIIPAMNPGDLWPNQGFFLKVADLSHALFVSLPEEEVDMVLSNKLQLGQLVYVDRFEAAYPVPMVKGIRPLPGRRLCHGSPKDLIPVHHLERFLGVSGLEKTRSLSSSEVGSAEGTNRRSRLVSWTIEESQGSAKDILRKSNSQCLSSSKPCRRHSLNPVPISMHDHSHSASKCRRSLISIATKSTKNLSKENSCKNVGLVSGEISEDTQISLDFLPPDLWNLGQELLRKRNIAFAAAIDALQEAAAADKTLKNLSAYSELLSAKSDDRHNAIDKFFKLQDDLARSSTLVEALSTSISTGQAPNSTDTKEERQSVERKYNATSWIISALESDLSPVPGPIKAGTRNADTNSSPKRTTNPLANPRRPSFAKNRRSNGDLRLELGWPMNVVDRQPEWAKGAALTASAELADTLRNEYETWFLSHVEEYLNWVSSQSSHTQSDKHVAKIMYRIKQVSDWFDKRFKDSSSTSDGSELETCGKVRSKIYGILLKHVERTAINAKSD